MYSVKQLATLAGVSVRALHYYDQIGLLMPSFRSGNGYRQYDDDDLIRLQQVLLYKELGLSLKEIKAVVDAEDFSVIEALRLHQQEVLIRRERLTVLLDTIDKTLTTLIEGDTMTHEDLYKGFSKEQAEAYRQEAVEKWGEAVERSEAALMKMGKSRFAVLQADFDRLWRSLSMMVHERPDCEKVQASIRLHCEMIKQFWGMGEHETMSKERYIGLGEMYVCDGRYTEIDGKVVPGFGEFMLKAMTFYAEKNLK